MLFATQEFSVNNTEIASKYSMVSLSLDATKISNEKQMAPYQGTLAPSKVENTNVRRPPHKKWPHLDEKLDF